MQKAKTVIEFHQQTGIPLELKVCWYRKAGKNCSECEKCYRTIMNIVANHGNPNNFGFIVNSITFERMHRYLENNYVNIGFWDEIQHEFQRNRTYWENNKDISWILDFKFNRIKALKNKAITIVKRFLK